MKIKELHPWDLTPHQARQLQHELAQDVSINPMRKTIRTIAGADVSCMRGDNRLYATVVVLDALIFEILEEVCHVEKSCFDYITGLLSFRELPPLLTAFSKLKNRPDLVMCDGQGIAHPRGVGIASHLGLWLDIPTIGCGKSRLLGEFDSFERLQGNQSSLRSQKKEIGRVICTKNRSCPLFISPGHLINVEGSAAWVQKSLVGYRLPEPTRQAHLAVNHFRKSFLTKTA